MQHGFCSVYKVALIILMQNVFSPVKFMLCVAYFYRLAHISGVIIDKMGHVSKGVYINDVC